MARKVKMLLSLGFDDQQKYKLREQYMEDAVIDVSDEEARVLVNVLGIAKDFNAAEEREHGARVESFDERVIAEHPHVGGLRKGVEDRVRSRLKGKSPAAAD